MIERYTKVTTKIKPWRNVRHAVDPGQTRTCGKIRAHFCPSQMINLVSSAKANSNTLGI